MSVFGRLPSICLQLALCLLLFSSFPLSAADPSVQATIDGCVERIAARTQPGQVTSETLWDAAGLCQTMIASQGAVDEERIRQDNFIFQRSENVVLMWMVVSITIAGVALAGAQLLASYALAKTGRGTLVGGGTIDLSKDKLAVQSSVVGVIVLAISFAFFLVFVLYVYTFQDATKGRGAPSANAGEPAHQISSGPLRPLTTPATK